MKYPFNEHAPSFDAQAINATIQRALAAAGLDTTTGPMHGVTETIRRALATAQSGRAAPNARDESVIDVAVREVPGGEPADPAWIHLPPTDEAQQTKQQQTQQETGQQETGSFTAHTYSNDAGTRAYKVYVPLALPEAPRVMVVMLHGCTQSADDFAAGTRMNQLADQLGFLVVYPEQARQANTSACWNWFKPDDQMRGAGEPSLIAGIVHDVARRHDNDPRRIFVAGLSAGAAMAVVLGETYPELFAGIGVHSGLAYGSAHDIPSAISTMKGGRTGVPGLKAAQGAGERPPRKALQAVPTIVFHGDRDHTVRHSNAALIVRQAHEAHEAHAALHSGATATTLRVETQTGVARGGRRFSRTLHVDAEGQTRIESWTVHGAGHAWSGGGAKGSFTDVTGPDASAEMVRFFLALPRAGSA